MTEHPVLQHWLRESAIAVRLLFKSRKRVHLFALATDRDAGKSYNAVIAVLDDEQVQKLAAALGSVGIGWEQCQSHPGKPIASTDFRPVSQGDYDYQLATQLVADEDAPPEPAPPQRSPLLGLVAKLWK